MGEGLCTPFDKLNVLEGVVINPSTMCWPILLLQGFLLSDRSAASKQTPEMQSKFSETPCRGRPPLRCQGRVTMACAFQAGPSPGGRWESPKGYLCPATFRTDPQGKGELGSVLTTGLTLLMSYAMSQVLILAHPRKRILWALEAELLALESSKE